MAPPPLPQERVSLESLGVLLKGLSEEFSREREARQREQEEGISIMRLHVPVPAALAFVAALIAPTIAIVGNHFRITNHITDDNIHADHAMALKRGGIAYKDDVKETVAAEASDSSSAARKLARAIRTPTFCPQVHQHGTVGVVCAFQDVFPLLENRER